MVIRVHKVLKLPCQLQVKQNMKVMPCEDSLMVHSVQMVFEELPGRDGPSAGTGDTRHDPCADQGYQQMQAWD